MPDRAKKILPVLICALVGLAVSVAIEMIHRRLSADVNYVSFCNVNSRVNCDRVLGSRFASLGGVSVANWAILHYFTLAALAVGVAAVRGAARRETLARLILVLATWGLLFSIYLAAVALLALQTVCLMCSALYLVGITLFVAAWWLRAAVRISGRRGAAERAGRDRLVLTGGLAATLALVVIGGWEAFGGGVQQLDADAIARERPDFYRWYLAQPVTQVPHDPADEARARGSVDAPVTLVEFSAFECGHCAAFHTSLEDVLPRFGQSVRVIFHHFPLDPACNPSMSTSLHPRACLAAIAAECAAEQHRFWQYQDLLFDNQQQLDRQFLLAYAGRLGLDVARFTACLASPEARERVDRDAAIGAQLGIDSTPTLFINGRTIRGALDADKLATALTLAEANAKTP